MITKIQIIRLHLKNWSINDIIQDTKLEMQIVLDAIEEYQKENYIIRQSKINTL